MPLLTAETSVLGVELSTYNVVPSNLVPCPPPDFIMILIWVEGCMLNMDTTT